MKIYVLLIEILKEILGVKQQDTDKLTIEDIKSFISRRSNSKVQNMFQSYEPEKLDVFSFQKQMEK